ncbi:hypothetical protein QBC38DRAFT_276906 [Podospora fimiseda]|uniref:Uncharacterized protein n=1 Tax=Podospora fimiseda TaxID=252190 RepID=A0AAN7H7F5_9PEZI|nr:hypothetical protein QBC38DRAFT_276906 [Podospora fimiseda]
MSGNVRTTTTALGVVKVSGHKTRQVWTPEEDRRLSEAVRLETPDQGAISWHKVAAHLPGRNNKDCRKRWHYSIANTIRKGTWTKEEDHKLRQAVDKYGARWSKIAEAVGTRNGDQCWKRWYDCLDPKIDKSPWTADEDARLVRQVAKHGRNWSDIVHTHFPNRTSLAAKNRYSILQRKQENASRARNGTHKSSCSPNSNLSVPVFTPCPSTAATTPEPDLVNSQPEWTGVWDAEIDDFFQQSFASQPAEGWYSDSISSSTHTPSPQLGTDMDWNSPSTTWSSPTPSTFAPSPSPLCQTSSCVPLEATQPGFQPLPMPATAPSTYNMLGIYQPSDCQSMIFSQQVPVQGGGLEYLQPQNVYW